MYRISKKSHDPRNASKAAIHVGGEVIKILVGPNEKAYTIHKDILATNSPFFESAIKEVWTPKERGTIPLPEDVRNAFELYIEWIYQRRLPCLYENDEKETMDSSLITHAIAMSEKLQDNKFRDALNDAILAAVMDELSGAIRWLPGPQEINHIFKWTPKLSKARKLLVDIHVNHGQCAWLEKKFNEDELADLHQDFLTDLVEGVFEKYCTPYWRDPTNGSDPCQYHDHDRLGEPCYRTLI
ncbi:MAG: hypothetical protein M1820_009753 [Bogoriella megaspora]|nr:MAG: hypothetical protein M1820_009753 [Bogoriella megaspora]